MKHNRTRVTPQEMLNEIKLIGEEIEISQIDRTICTHGDTNATLYKQPDQNKETNCLIINPAKRSNL